MSSTHISNLPEEMLRKILKLLPHEDLMRVMLVCKSWQEKGEDPALWTLFMVAVNTRDDIQKLRLPRFQSVQTVQLCSTLTEVSIGGGYEIFQHDCDLQQPDGLKDLFHAISAIPSISEIDGIWTYDLRALEPGLYASVMTRLTLLRFGRELTEEQIDNIFTLVAEENTDVEEIFIDFSNPGFEFRMDKLSPHLFASAVTKVRKLAMFGPMESDQEKFKEMFKMVKEEKIFLKEVTICLYYYNLLASIETDILGTALSRLEDVHISGPSRLMGGGWSKLDQVTNILRKLLGDDSKLERLELKFLKRADIEKIDPELVRQVIKKIGEFFENDSYMDYDEGDNVDDIDEVIGDDDVEDEVIDDEDVEDDDGDIENEVIGDSAVEVEVIGVDVL